MPVYEDKRNNTFYYIVDTGKNEAGKRTQTKKRGFATRKEAEEAMKLVEAEVLKGEFVLPSRVTLGELTEAYLDAKKTGNIGRQTLQTYEFNINKHILPRFTNNPVQRISPMMIQKFYNELSSTLAPATVLKIHQILKGILDLGMQWDIISTNPTAVVVKPKLKPPEHKIWSEEDAARFLKAIHGKEATYLAFVIVLTLGLRQGEVLGLQL